MSDGGGGAKKSRWQDDSDDESDDVRRAALQKRLKRVKEADPAEARASPTPPPREASPAPQQPQQAQQAPLAGGVSPAHVGSPRVDSPAASADPAMQGAPPEPIMALPRARPVLAPCRNVNVYEKLNRIDEGTYGVVYRARERETGRAVALKRLKIENEKEGFPITSLREINTLLACRHPHIVEIIEIVVGDELDQFYMVMEFLENDARALLEDMKRGFSPSEVKTLMHQLLSAMAHMHDNWMIHRDLKPSNLLMSNQGELKVADFGLARFFGDPQDRMTPNVVTQFYRAPEVLLGSREYTTAVDMWSVGCIFAELMTRDILFQGRSELDQLAVIFKMLGRPSPDVWPGFDDLPYAKRVNFDAQPYNFLPAFFRDKHRATNNAIDLLNGMLRLDPARRLTAEQALRHPYFSEPPAPKHPSMFPSFPSKGEGQRRERTPPAQRGRGGKQVMDEDEMQHLMERNAAAQFQLKF